MGVTKVGQTVCSLCSPKNYSELTRLISRP